MHYKAVRVLVVPTPVQYAYFTGLGMEGIVHERQMRRRIAKVKFYIFSLRAFFRVIHYGMVRLLSYERIMVGCRGYGALVWVPTAMIEEWLRMGILRLIRNTEVDEMLALVAVARVAEVDWAASPDQKWLSYD